MSARDHRLPFPHERVHHAGPSHLPDHEPPFTRSLHDAGPSHLPDHEPPFTRSLHGASRPEFHGEGREAHYSLSGPSRPPPRTVLIEEWLTAQNEDIQALLGDNQRLAATHVALRQELEFAQHELQQADEFARTLHEEKGSEMRALCERSAKIENEIHAVNGMRSELMQVHMDIKHLTAARQDLTAQVGIMSQDRERVTSDLRRIPVVKSEIEGLRHDLECLRASIVNQKKSFAESFEHGQAMENKLISMAREMEKLRAELANAEKRAQAAAYPGNPGLSYGNPESIYSTNPYAPVYGTTSTNSMHPVYGATSTNSMHPPPAVPEAYQQPGPGAWWSYDTQRTQGSR